MKMLPEAEVFPLRQWLNFAFTLSELISIHLTSVLIYENIGIVPRSEIIFYKEGETVLMREWLKNLSNKAHTYKPGKWNTE